MTLRNVPEGAYEQASYAARHMLAIRSAAGDRPFTRAQETDYAELNNLFSTATDKLGGTSAYVRALVDQAKENPDRPDSLDQAASALEYENLRGAGDQFRSQSRAVIEGPSGRRDDGQILRDMFRRARDGGYSAHESYINPGLFESRALQSQGGSAVPTSFADFVTVYQRTLNPMLNPAVTTILGRTDGSPLVLPRLTADPAAGGTVTAEAAGITELDSTVSSVQLNPYKYAITNLYSAELADDNTIGLEELLASSAARELAIDIGAHLTTGDGSAKPQGFIGAATNGGTAAGTASWGASATFFGWGDLVTLWGSIAAPYRTVGSWMVSPDAFTKILQFRDTNNQPILIPGLGGAPSTVLGRPIYENPAMASVASASKSVAFGDFSRYVVARVSPIRVQTSIHYKFSTDQVALRTVDRIDGDLIDTAAVAYLISANT